MGTRKHQKDSDVNAKKNTGFPRKHSKPTKTVLVLVAIAVMSAISGTAIAKILASKPLSHTTLAHSADSITGVIPANLERPVNILILGTDNSGNSEPSSKISHSEALAGNSDTMLLVRLTPKNHEINILSIPRDTLVNLPSIGIDKINDANVQGGASLAVDTVSQLLNNIQIDRYVRLDTQGFIQLVDALGGVEVIVPKPMDYVDRTQKLQIHFLAGIQKLNGQHLQEYIRFRHDELGDIGRVQRQQSALRAILQTLTKPENIGKTPQLLEVTQKNVDTDLSIGEMLAIHNLLKDTDRKNIHMFMLPGRFSRPDEYPLSYWIEDSEAKSTILTRFFEVAKPSSDVAGNHENLTINRGQLRIAVISADRQPAIANKIVTQLQQRGFNGAYISDRDIDIAAEDMLTTQVIAEQGNPEVAKVIQRELGMGQVQISATGDINSDVTIVIGKDSKN